MILTNKQEQGLKIAVQRFWQGEPYTCISGYAGSGKSTLIKFIIAALEVDPEEDVCYCAFTGKAANVLSQKGCPNAVTAHKLLYKAKQLPNGKYKFTKRDVLEKDYKVIVVDEVSMLPAPMWNQLIKHGVYILATGDPGQLPPIDPELDNHVLDNPHIFLDEVMRQAQDSEIIRLSMWIREGKSLETFPCQKEQVQILDKKEISIGLYNWADQILCATNDFRAKINNAVRVSKGFGVEPEIGDKIISLHNHWEFMSKNESWALTNGSIGTIEHMQKNIFYPPRYISTKSIPYLYTSVSLEDGDGFDYIPIDYNTLVKNETTLTPQQAYKMKKNDKMPEPPYEFAYAYAITCHKAQGSEWEKVVAIEEWFPNVADEHKRWLYTAATRASKKLVIVKK